MHSSTRTRLAVVGLAAALAAGTTAPALASDRDDKDKKAEKARATNIILLIGDGMGQTHVDAGRLRFYGANGALNMERGTVTGSVSTYAVEKGSDLPALVTDSASAATAWSSGVKTYNAAIGVDTHGTFVGTLMEEAKAAGMRTGNVSTAEVTDATPAGMFSHAALRGCQGPTYSLAACGTKSGDPAVISAGDVFATDASQGGAYLPIAQQVARNGTADVILGGGNSRFTAADQQVMANRGYQVLGSFGSTVATKDQLAAAAATQGKLIGLFNTGNLTPEFNKAKGFPTVAVQAEPSLPQMTSKALEVLAKSSTKKGFFLQVEGASIDKRSHANDASQVLGEIKAFDDAVAAAKAFAAKDKNTLVIITADHECAGFNIIEQGTYTNAEAVSPPSNQGGTSSTETPARPTRGALDPARSTGIVNGAGSADPKNFAPATFRTADDPAGVTDGSPEASLWLAYLSGNHTGADVPIYSTGPGSENFRASIDNTDIYSLMRGSLKSLRH